MTPEAHALATEIHKSLPDHPHLAFFLGIIHSELKQTKKAIEYYERALELNPTMIYPRVNLVQVLCGEGRERAALEHAKVAVVAEEGNADRHYMLGCIHRTLGNHLEAAQSFARAVKLRPTFLEAYINNDAVLLKLGSLKGCYKYAEMAVRETRAHGVPFWTNPLQRPPAFVPGLSARAWHDPARFEWTRRLEAAFPAMLQELRMLMGERAVDQRAAQPPAHWGSVGGRSTHDGDLVKAGDWKEFPLLGGTGPIVENLQKCPTVAELLLSVPELVAMSQMGMGETLFSVITPGTHLRPHCGSTNARLTAHMGFIVPDGCSIRAGTEWRQWQVGKCIVFDDSFEHEVKHEGEGVRVVLLMNFWHPELPRERWGPVVPQSQYGVA